MGTNRKLTRVEPLKSVTMVTIPSGQVRGGPYVDRRMGAPKYYDFRPEHLDMLIPPEIHQSVVYLGTQEAGGEVAYKGTGFFVCLPKSSGGQHSYLVTARHNVEKLRQFGKTFVVRGLDPTNRMDAKQLTVEDRWFVLPPNEPFVDAAIMRWDSRALYWMALDRPMWADDEHLKGQAIGAGDDVCVVGLFSPYLPQGTHEPIIRTGNICLMPKSEMMVNFMDENRFRSMVYLIELKSLGGISGSPALVHKAHFRMGDEGTELYHQFTLLGLVHGHWNVGVTERNESTLRVSDNPAENANLGIAVVVPFKEVMKLLYHHEVVKEREAAESAAAAVPIEDGQ